MPTVKGQNYVLLLNFSQNSLKVTVRSFWGYLIGKGYSVILYTCIFIY